MSTWVLAPIGIYIVGKLIERRWHERTLQRVPLRIHVNGSRGKTQTTYLLTQALQAAGLRAAGKVTGTLPLMIGPEGERHPLARRGPANIAEQKTFLRYAARHQIKVAVLECMAIRPDLQRVSERALIQSQIGIVTNVRPDHFEELGCSPEQATAALAETLPFHGIAFTAEHSHIAPLVKIAKQRETQLIQVQVEDMLSPAERMFLPTWQHEENVALVLAVCDHLNLDRSACLRTILDALPLPGAFAIRTLRIQNQVVQFADAFSANDPQSAAVLLERIRTLEPTPLRIMGIYNHRSDRPIRAKTFRQFAMGAEFADLLIVGDPLPGWRRIFPMASAHLGSQILRRIVPFVHEKTKEGDCVFGFGNMAGAGWGLSQFWANQEVPD